VGEKFEVIQREREEVKMRIHIVHATEGKAYSSSGCK
jgi:hypothetical protein